MLVHSSRYYLEFMIVRFGLFIYEIAIIIITVYLDLIWMIDYLD